MCHLILLQCRHCILITRSVRGSSSHNLPLMCMQQAFRLRKQGSVACLQAELCLAWCVVSGTACSPHSRGHSRCLSLPHPRAFACSGSLRGLTSGTHLIEERTEIKTPQMPTKVTQPSDENSE